MRATSIEAYKSTRDGATIHRHIILRTMKQVNVPLIAEEISKLSGLQYNQVSRRMSELERENKVTCTDETSLTTSGRRAYKWKLCETD